MSTEFTGSAELSLEGNQSGPELPFFTFSSIAKATNNFSEENKLGQGGFGPVYKVKMLQYSSLYLWNREGLLRSNKNYLFHLPGNAS